MNNETATERIIVRNLPLEEKIRLYNEALSLRNKFKFGSMKIAKILNVTRGTIDAWVYDGSNPDFCRTKFEPRKTPELSYLIGVIFGDASVWKSKENHYFIELKVKDRDFADYFASCINKLLLNKKKAITARPSGNYFRVVAISKAFYRFICGKKLSELEGYIEPNVSNFLQGFFDSEGNPHIEAKNCFVVKIGAANTSLEILEYIRKSLIEKIGIESRITICNKAGSKTMISGKEITRRFNVYRLMIHRFEDTKKFCNVIGFTAKRKQEKLADAIKNSENYDNSQAIQLWTRFYTKVGREWVKKII